MVDKGIFISLVEEGDVELEVNWFRENKILFCTYRVLGIVFVVYLGNECWMLLLLLLWMFMACFFEIVYFFFYKYFDFRIDLLLVLENRS